MVVTRANVEQNSDNEEDDRRKIRKDNVRTAKVEQKGRVMTFSSVDRHVMQTENEYERSLKTTGMIRQSS